ncbi:MAG: hypothetical protein K9J79_08240 [Desulfobacteraceae bacterium]|nr:hypothetical protein [Desulfobacteraceae bacterium]
MDIIDRLNDTALNLVLNWRNIYIFAAAIFIIATIYQIAERGRIEAWHVISWILVLLIGYLIFRFSKGSLLDKKAEGKSE